MLEDDPQLLAAMEMFAAMSIDEKQEILSQLTEMFGDSDPATLKLLEQAMGEVAQMNPEEMKTSLKDMVQEDEIMVAIADTLKMLSNVEGDAWETILANKDNILQAVIQSGKISEEDAQRYSSDPSAWEKDLEAVWDEVKKVARTEL